MGLRSVLVYHTKSVNGIKMHFVEAGGRASSISPPWLPGDMVRVAASDSGTGAQLPVIAFFFSGYGETEKPASGYDKHTMARDIYELMRELGYRRAPL
ncbi:MAG: hypothetical protein JO108_23590, partial [Acidobacteriaceae bacterium]|nr:hypothetical protein [Acidobacteriaceae bacterium]